MAKIELFRHAEKWLGFEPGKTVFNEGEPGDCMYVVVEGEIEIISGGKVLEVAGPGSTVGELALIDHGPRSASAIARTNARLVPLDAKQFQLMVQQTPFFALQVMSIMAERLRRWRP
jgi:CRP/FNR family transcriptional regulator, cyclic AMP receptor protein